MFMINLYEVKGKIHCDKFRSNKIDNTFIERITK